jgi:AcrR family transcriptional regulator
MATQQTAPGGRVYRGMTSAERHDDRRRRLLDAGLELFGTAGYGATTIEGICQRAGVTARNFYDHFDGREDLLLAVYGEVVEGHSEQVRAAFGALPDDDLEGRIHAGVGTALSLWLADERRARVAFLEVVGVSPRVEERRLAVIDGYTDMLLGELARFAPRGRAGSAARARMEIVGNALVGGVVHVLTERLTRPDRAPFEQVVDELTRLFVAAIGATIDA